MRRALTTGGQKKTLELQSSATAGAKPRHEAARRELETSIRLIALSSLSRAGLNNEKKREITAFLEKFPTAKADLQGVHEEMMAALPEAADKEAFRSVVDAEAKDNWALLVIYEQFLKDHPSVAGVIENSDNQKTLLRLNQQFETFRAAKRAARETARAARPAARVSAFAVVGSSSGGASASADAAAADDEAPALLRRSSSVHEARVVMKDVAASSAPVPGAPAPKRVLPASLLALIPPAGSASGSGVFSERARRHLKRDQKRAGLDREASAAQSAPVGDDGDDGEAPKFKKRG